MTREQWPRTVPIIDLQPDQATKLVSGLPDRPEVIAVIPLPGGLTNSNYRFDFRDGRPSIEAKLYQHEPSLAPIERAVHELGAERGLPMPKLIGGDDASSVTSTPYSLFQWVRGERLDLAVHAIDPASLYGLAEKVGEALAKVHAVHFETFGFFNADLTLNGPIDLSGAGMQSYFDDVLRQGLVRERLGPQCAEALLAFATREAAILDTWTCSPCLTHGDCGGTNILVAHEGSAWSVTGIIDWEFAFSGTPFFDLGNLLRAPLGALPEFIKGLAEGYRRAGGNLPDHWQALAAMTDLLAWVDSARRAHISDAFVLSARQAISETIAGWRRRGA